MARFSRKHRGASIFLLIALVVGLIYVAVAYGYPDDPKDGVTTTTPGKDVKAETKCTAPRTVGEAKDYVECLKAHDDRLRAGEDQDIALYKQEIEMDNTLEAEAVKDAEECEVCPIIYLPPPDPAPTLDPLVGLTIPEFQGNDDDPLSDENRSKIDAMENLHDANQDRFIWNDKKKWTYSLYLKARISYYEHPNVKCPEAEKVVIPETVFTPEFVPTPAPVPTPTPTPTPTPGPSPGPGPTPIPRYKIPDTQTNPTTGQPSTDPPPDGGSGTPPAQQTQSGQEPV